MPDDNVQRLKSRAQFQAVLSAGTVARTSHFAMHRLPLGSVSSAGMPAGGAALLADAGAFAVTSVRPAANSGALPELFPCAAPWMGAMVPKRWAKHAVTRNAIKRQIYALSTDSAEWPPAAHVIRLRATFDRKQFVSASSDLLKQAVRAELLRLFDRARSVPL